MHFIYLFIERGEERERNINHLPLIYGTTPNNSATLFTEDYKNSKELQAYKKSIVFKTSREKNKDCTSKK